MAFTRGFVATALSLVVAGIAHGQAPFIGSNFTGVTYNTNPGGGWYPPDTQGAAGPNHYVEMANGSVRYYRKSDGTVLQEFPLNTFWTLTGAATVGNTYDPRVYFDASAGRWFTAVNDALGNNPVSGFAVAVSVSSDPTAGWTGFRFDADSANTRWADFVTMGVSQNWVTLQNNMFAFTGGATTTVSILTIPKANLLAGNASGSQYTFPVNANDFGFTAHPVSDLDMTSATGYILSNYNNSNHRLAKITGTVTAPTVAGTNFIAIDNTPSPPSVDQPGSGTNIGSGDNRIGSTPTLVNGKLWSVRAVSSGGAARLHWTRINPVTGVLEEQGLIPAPSTAAGAVGVYFPAIAVNPAGDIVVGFSGSNADTFPSAYAVTGRYNGGSGAGSVTWGTPVQVGTGTSFWDIGGGRYGDYSQASVDPADPGIFWVAQEFVASQNNYAIRNTEVIPPRTGEVRWPAAAAGNFAAGANWIGGAVPAATDHAIFSRWSLNSYTVTLPAGTTANDRLSVRQTGVAVTAPPIVTFSLPAGATWNLTNAAAATPSLAVAEFGGTANVLLAGAGTVNAQHARVGSATGAGTLNLNGGVTVNLAGSLTLGGSTSAINVGTGGTAATLVVGGGLTNPAGSTPAINVAVANSLLRLNGTGSPLYTGTIAAGTGGKVDGSGTVGGQIRLNAGGVLQGGTGGAATATNTLTAGSLQLDGANTFRVAFADTNVGNGIADVTASRIALGAGVLSRNTGGAATDLTTIKLVNTGASFDAFQSYTVVVATFGGTSNLALGNFTVDPVGEFFVFGNPVLSLSGTQLTVTFVPVPEPGSLLAVAGLGLAGWRAARRRRVA